MGFLISSFSFLSLPFYWHCRPWSSYRYEECFKECVGLVATLNLSSIPVTKQNSGLPGWLSTHPDPSVELCIGSIDCTCKEHTPNGTTLILAVEMKHSTHASAYKHFPARANPHPPTFSSPLSSSPTICGIHRQPPFHRRPKGDKGKEGDEAASGRKSRIRRTPMEGKLHHLWRQHELFLLDGIWIRFSCCMCDEISLFCLVSVFVNVPDL